MPPPPQQDNEQKPVDLALIKEPNPPSQPPEDLATQEQRSFERGKRELLLKDLSNEVDARRDYAKKIYGLMIAWMTALVIFVSANSIRWPWASKYVSFGMSDAVLITLVTTTTGTVVSVFLIVAKYLYRPRLSETADSQS